MDKEIWQGASREQKTQGTNINQDKEPVWDRKNDIRSRFETDIWWCQNLDQVQIKHKLGLKQSTGVE